MKVKVPPGAPETGTELIERMKEAGVTRVLLAFSCGKDSIAAWLAIRDHFEVVPFVQMKLYDLGMVEESINYYEQWFGTKILRCLHPSEYRMLEVCLFQTPERRRVLHRAFDYVHEYDYEQMRDWMLEDMGEDKSLWQATGVRASDSVMRRSAVSQYGPINRSRRTFWPIFDWGVDDMEKEFRRVDIKMPVDYQIFGRTIDGIDYRFLRPLREHFPRDYEEVLRWFPLADLNFMRKAMWERYKGEMLSGATEG